MSPKVEQIPLQSIIIDPRVQRPLNPKRVDEIASSLNPDAIGVLCVSHREDGSYSMIDGQHRLRSLEVAGFSDSLVTCEVYEGLSISDEAAMFRLRNNTAQVSYIDKFRVRNVEGDPDAVEIMDILNRNGWKLGMSAKDRQTGYFSAISVFERIYHMNKNSKLAERVLIIVTEAWGHNPHGVDGRIIHGLGLVLNRYGEGVSQRDLTHRLSVSPGGPSALVGRARGLAGLISTTVSRAMAEVIVGLYNNRRRVNQLPPWRAT